ncbi:MAG: putative dehydrogenase [Granulosicoccus sp.]|jgi:predicted dehydrogenase
MKKTTVGIGLIGTGFMGRCHANAYRSVGGLFDLPLVPIPVILGDASYELARKGADVLGFLHFTADWRAVVNHPEVAIVSITAPNAWHEVMALEAIAAGKTVYCEKPLSVTAASALKMTEAAEKAKSVTMVGFNFLRNPMIATARQMIAAGEIGEVTGFRARHAENYMANSDVAHSFRTDLSGGGALADIGSHVISMMRFLVGPIVEVSATSKTIHASRPVTPGSAERKPVEVDDMTHALVKMSNGAVGSLEANWAATARTMDLSFEITGTHGAIAFTQERMNELQYYGVNTSERAGYQRIESGPQHPPYAQFCPAPGHHLGFNDLKIIEVAELIEAHARKEPGFPDFREAYEVQRVVEAMLQSHQTRQWVAL